MKQLVKELEGNKFIIAMLVILIYFMIFITLINVIIHHIYYTFIIGAIIIGVLTYFTILLRGNKK